MEVALRSVCVCVPLFMEVHAAYGGRVSVQRVNTLPRLGVPHLQSPICRAADDDVVSHLRGPDAARVSD